jgi:A1 cistron-splicing factor AAR2
MNIDKSQTLKEQMGAFSFSSILGELQYAFIGFIIGTDAECMEHWAQLLDLLCTCNAYSQDNPQEYCKFIETLRKQLSQFPRDFFFDNITKDNFMRESLYSLYALVTQSINEEIKKEGTLLFKILNSEFKFDASDSEGLSD